ncbi:MAG: extracellular solute-binding protein [Clostridiales bacterium]|nr:extracellular solute-binding protein [Clostridiales bacterium]
MKKVLSRVLSLLMVCAMALLLSGCSTADNKVIIYTSAEDYRVEYLTSRLKEEFPDYQIVIEYMATGNHAAKLKAEGTDTECDITYDLEYPYLQELERQGILTDLSSYDYSIYTDNVIESKHYLPEAIYSASIIVNPAVLSAKGLEAPKSFEDLIKPEYKGLISMPNPKSSGTGFMVLKAYANTYGEEAAFEYFDQLAQNVLQFTSSGSGPVNALIQQEVAIGLGMTAQAVTAINNGTPLDIYNFDSGSPFSVYGQSVIKGKESKPAVKAVFDFMMNTFNMENNARFYPERIYKDTLNVIENYPSDIVYCDMSNNTNEERQRLLDKWKY